MSTEHGARCGYFRFFVLSRSVNPDDAWLDGICDAASLGISAGDENFIRKALQNETPHLLAVTGRNRSPIFVLTGPYPSAGALVAFVCDLSLRDFCEAGDALAEVEMSPRFISCLKNEGCRATSRENAALAVNIPGRLLNLVRFTDVNVELWPYSNDVSKACMSFARTAGSLCGCLIDTNFLYPCGVPVKMFDRGVFAAFIVGMLNCVMSEMRSNIRIELDFYLDETKRFFARFVTDGRPDEIYFRVAADAADRADVKFLITDGQVVISPTREEHSLLGIKVKFRIRQAPGIKFDTELFKKISQ